MNTARSEIRKLTTLRITWLLLGAAVLLSAAIGAVNVHALDGGGGTAPALALAAAQPSWFLVIVVAVLSSAGEFQHKTVVTTLLSTPGRATVLAWKAAVAAGFGILVTTAAMGSSLGSGMVTARMDDVSLVSGGAHDWLGVAGAVLVGGLWAIMASALGLLTRSTATALTSVLLWKFVAEGVLPVVLHRPRFTAWTPSGAAASVLDISSGGLTAPMAALLLTGYASTLCLAAAVSFLRRDPA